MGGDSEQVAAVCLHTSCCHPSIFICSVRPVLIRNPAALFHCMISFFLPLLLLLLSSLAFRKQCASTAAAWISGLTQGSLAFAAALLSGLPRALRKHCCCFAPWSYARRPCICCCSDLWPYASAAHALLLLCSLALREHCASAAAAFLSGLMQNLALHHRRCCFDRAFHLHCCC